MKKIYKQPVTEVVKINVSQMLQSSPTPPAVVNGEAGTDALDKEDYEYFDGNLW